MTTKLIRLAIKPGTKAVVGIVGKSIIEKTKPIKIDQNEALAVARFQKKPPKIAGKKTNNIYRAVVDKVKISLI